MSASPEGRALGVVMGCGMVASMWLSRSKSLSVRLVDFLFWFSGGGWVRFLLADCTFLCLRNIYHTIYFNTIDSR